MKPIKLNKYIRIGKCLGNEQKCSYCNVRIGKGKVGLTIYKPNYAINIWIHINCVEKFVKDILKFKKDNIRDIILENLIDK